MTAAWIVYGLVVGTLLAVAALAAEGVCRLAARPTRWVWAGALALTVALTALAPQQAPPPLVPNAGVPSVVGTDAAVDVRPGPLSPTHLLTMLHELRETIAAPVRHGIAASEHRVPASLDRGLTVVWLSMSALLLALFSAVYLRFRRERRTWPAAEVHSIRVRIAPEAGPAVVGLSRPEIIIPRWLLLRSVEEQRLALAHEQEHVRARDPLLLAAACIVAALLPWHPAVWWILSRLRLAVELDCDRRVLSRGAAPRSYGALLIELAGRCSGLRLAAPALADSTSHLERRILAMKPQRRRFAFARGGALGVFAVLALLGACETQLPTSAEVDKMDVASAEKSAVRGRLIASMDSVVYMIDGARASAAQAHALNPDEIASINIRKAVDRLREIMITTKRAAAKSGSVPKPVDGLVLIDGAHDGHGGHKTVVAVTDTIGGAFSASKKSFAGLLLIDGVQADNATLDALSPNRIKSVEVIKGPAAAKLYTDPKAVNGVIRIITKDGATGK